MKQKYQLCNAGGIFHYIKLTKKHWWSRWKPEMDGGHPKIYMLHGVPSTLHVMDISFDEIKKEFIDAMKDELTWEDMKAIVKIADDLDPTHDTEHLLSEFQSEEGLYTEILKRFKEEQNGAHL